MRTIEIVENSDNETKQETGYELPFGESDESGTEALRKALIEIAGDKTLDIISPDEFDENEGYTGGSDGSGTEALRKALIEIAGDKTLDIISPGEFDENPESLEVDDISFTENEHAQRLDDDTQPKPHNVSATILEVLDTEIDLKRAREMSTQEYPNKKTDQLADNLIKGIIYEAMVERELKDEYGKEHVTWHPDSLKLTDGRPIEPDFAITDSEGEIKLIPDAKAYTRKDTHNPEASASALTHVRNLEKTSRYVDVDLPSVDEVPIFLPRETGDMRAVQEKVSSWGNDECKVSVESAGSEAEIKQRMEYWRQDEARRYDISDESITEIGRIQELPVEERRQAMGEYMLSLRDDKGDETIEGANLRRAMSVGRNGNSVTITDSKNGREYTIGYQ